MAAYGVTNTANAPRDAYRQGGGDIIAAQMAPSVTIYKGNLVVVDRTTGLASQAPSDATTDQYDLFVGVAAETVTSPAVPVGGATFCNCYVTGTFQFADVVDTLDDTFLGKPMYHDSATAGSGSARHVESTGASANDMKVGVLVGRTGTAIAHVRINGFAGMATAGAAAVA